MLSRKLTLKEVNVTDKRVFIRVDFNVPIYKGKVKDNKRIAAALPTIQYCIDHGARSIILASHLGRPDGRRLEEYSLRPVAAVLEELLQKPVIFVDDCVGDDVEKLCTNPPKGSIILLENVRFHIEEEGKGVDANQTKVKADPESVQKFRQCLTKLADVYVNDAFGTAHRGHSSMVGVNLPVRAAGFLMQSELQAFAGALESPKRPFLAVLGGAKVEDKIQLIDSLLDKVDELIICGGMAYTFLKVLQGKEIGTSIYDPKGAQIVPNLMKKAQERGVKIHFPIDFVIADKLSKEAVPTITKEIPADKMSLDHGPETTMLFAEIINQAKTILLNGPAGVFEIEQFARGTEGVLHAAAKATQEHGAFTVIGGGDSASSAKMFNLTSKFTHVSTGGGATISLLQNEPMPGIEALSDRTSKL